jgi:hypothetical protein
MSDSTKDIKHVERQLKRIIACVIQKAERDPEFLSQLSHILHSDVLKQTEPERSRRAAFNAVEFLHAHGREALQRELQFKTDEELKEILSQEGVKKQRGQKQLDREDAILTIITHAERRLAQGASFLQTGA